MTNSGNGRNEMTRNLRNSSVPSEQDHSIADAFREILQTADPGAILSTTWGETQGGDSYRPRGNARNQTEVDSDNFSADGKVRGLFNRSQWGNTARAQEDTSNREKNRKSEDNDGRIYSTNNIRNNDTSDDCYVSNGGYRDSSMGINTSRSDSIDNYTNNTSKTYEHSSSNENNGMTDGRQIHLTPIVPQPNSCNNISPSQDAVDEGENVALKISAWHTLADKNAKERPDGVGSGQLHRKGKNYKPVDEKTVLEIQQRGKTIKKTKRSQEISGDKIHSPTKSGPFPRGVSPKGLDKGNLSPKQGPPLSNPPHPTAQWKQPIQRRQSPPPSSSPKPPSQAQPPQQNAPERDHPNIRPKLDNTAAAFSEPPQNTLKKPPTVTKPPQQSQYHRYQSPARSQESLPFIPPEFDSTPYRKQPSPLPLDHRGGRNGDYEDQEDYDQSSEATTEYYEDSENELEYNKSGPPPILNGDRGELVLTINVELEEGENPQTIYVYVADDPLDLAREFCVKWAVTNEVVEPALAELIREEKEKRLDLGRYTN
ncbi:3770_t:CDS:1 [Acaulospora colombiana]|uniref:3770_t:CDS:1 n=1 Tax=Acaulospora colombiana TaxID=27376 RepID=A0ACA9LTB7_9GLOM|nr:3770_t:CDS:1 [Acaulospora colombiana]